MDQEKSLSQSLLVENVVKSKQKKDRTKKEPSLCERPMRCIRGRICGNTWTRLLSLWALLELGIVGVSAPVLWCNKPSWALVVWPIHGVLVLLFFWSWERTGVSSSVKDNPPPRRVKDHVKICSKCETWKPERCHHCKICGFCVLKMDHHCPWIGVCIGIKNYKAFCLFKTYACLLQVSLAATILPVTFIWLWIVKKLGAAVNSPAQELGICPDLKMPQAISALGDKLCWVSTVMFTLAMLLFVPLTFFVIRHINQILEGKTTVETILHLPVFLEEQTGWERFSEIFGSSLWRWPFPLSESEPDGYSFKPIQEDTTNTVTKSYPVSVPVDPGYRWIGQRSQSIECRSETSKGDTPTPAPVTPKTPNLVLDDERIGWRADVKNERNAGGLHSLSYPRSTKGNTSINSAGRGKSRLIVDSNYLEKNDPIGSSMTSGRRTLSNRIAYGKLCVDYNYE